ncbi:MAG TPA: hypothetical protein PK177_12340 [Burkholderiaceae bacterium]|nr:hypothetical protein [Burkholderiaceae bacterium]
MTQAVYDQWQQGSGLAMRSVREPADDEMRAIYESDALRSQAGVPGYGAMRGAKVDFGDAPYIKRLPDIECSGNER